jgi:hypothetical protein
MRRPRFSRPSLSELALAHALEARSFEPATLLGRTIIVFGVQAGHDVSHLR